MSNSSTKSFEDYFKKTQVEKDKPFKDALLWAKSEVKTESGRDFIASCEEQFNRKGFLTASQVKALYEIDQKKHAYRGEDEFELYNESDFAGGDF